MSKQISENNLKDEIEFNHAIIVERHKDIKQIEKTCLELNEMARDINMILHEQGEEIESIETHIMNSLQYSNEGVNQVREAQKIDREGGYCNIF